jgi:hypothetical protein
VLVSRGNGSYETRKVLGEDPSLLHEAEQLKEKPPDPAELGAELLQDIIDFLLRFVFMTAAQAIVLALWTVHTYCIAAADSTPYMDVNSPEPVSGKTRCLEVAEVLVAKPWFTGRVTAACLTRKIDAQKPTLLLDESDAAFASGEEYAEALRGVLNTGHRRGGKTSCCVGKGANIGFADFETFSPKMIAGLKSLPDTVRSRAIPIRLQRKPRNVKVEKFRQKKVKPDADKLRARIAAWSKAQIKKLRDIEPEPPEELSDRQADGAEPLLCIAEFVGHGWPEKARQALVELCTSADAEDLSPGVRLLTDIADIFIAENADRISSATLVEELVGIDTSQWAEWGKSHKPITQHALAKLLKKFNSYNGKKIDPRTIRIADTTPRGYYRKDFVDAWKRYTPNVPASLIEAAEEDKPEDEERRQETQPPQDLFHISAAAAADCCTSQSATATKVQQVSPNKEAACCAVAVETGGTREEEKVKGEL